MADSIGQAYVQILPTTKGFSSKLGAELGGGEGGGALKGAGKAMGQKLIGGLAAAGIAKGVTNLVSKSVKEAAKLQQSLGGVEAIFGKSADIVKKNAANAFKTVGVSANQYMETVTSFSASLIKGLGGDTEKAASYADMAMQDMGDNANRFGTDIQSIQNAYQGFAKGNFTMLDNLKLGYGGTKTEMLKLLKDTGVVEQNVKNLDNVSFDQMVEGIHRAQEQLNVTGTTANEAEKTFTGSLNAMKSVAQDLLGNLGMGVDITPQLQGLIQTATTFLTGPGGLGALISNVFNAVSQNAGALSSAAVQILTTFGKLILDNAPLLLKAGLDIIVGLGDGLVQSIPKMMPAISQTITDMALMLTNPKNLSSLIMTGLELIVAIAEGLGDAAPVLIGVIPDLVMNLVNTFIKLAPKLGPVAIKLVGTLASGLIGQGGALLTAGYNLFEKLKNKFSGFKDKFKRIGREIINGITNGLNEQKEKLTAKIREVANMLPDAVKKLLKIGSPSKVMADLYQWVPLGGVKGLQKTAPKLYQEMRNIVGNVTRMGTGSFDLAANVSGNGYGTDRNGAVVNQTINVGQMSSYKEAYMIRRATQQGVRKVMAGAALNE